MLTYLKDEHKLELRVSLQVCSVVVACFGIRGN